MKNIGILVPVLLAFLLNVEALDFSSCDNLSWRDRESCESEVCGYGPRSSDCTSIEFLHYGQVASKTGISLMVFIILLIVVVIIEKV